MKAFIERKAPTFADRDPPSVEKNVKKVENHEHMLALHYMYYNFARIHQSLRVTPTMEAGVSDHVWSLDEIIALLG